MNWLSRAFTCLSPVLAFGTVVRAEPCAPDWVSLGQSGSLANIYAFTEWDPDGSGPLSGALVAGGYFRNAPDGVKNVARWTGDEWVSLGDLGMLVRALATWDPDGDGPAAPVLIAGGEGTAVFAFDGESWTQLGGAFNAMVRRLAVWDADGDGPNAPVLVASGDFTTIAGASAPYIAAWNGIEWSTIGGGLPYPGRALTVWDADGDGPNPPTLVAGSSRVRVFDGTSWSMLDGSDDDGVSALATWDEDGDGPNPPVLYGAGLFDQSSESYKYFTRWNGESWERIGGVGAGTLSAESLVAGDPDGSGPAPTGVFFGSTNLNRQCYFWDGATLHDWHDGCQAPVYACAIHDPDGDGPLDPRLIIGGGSNSGLPVWRDEPGWQGLGQGLTGGDIAAFATWDPDGDGPVPLTVFAGGSISRAIIVGLAMITDGRWHQVGDGPAPYTSGALDPYTLVPWLGGPSPNGGGVLIANARYVPSDLGIPTGEIPMWTGSSWTSIPKPSGTLASISTWDPDGAGPEPEVLLASTNTNIYARDTDAWTSIATPAAPVKSSAKSWDPDGDGPALPLLIAPTGSSYVWRTRDTDWVPMPPAFTAQAFSRLSIIDPDGDGPEPQWVIASQSSGTYSRVVRWTGSAWDPISDQVTLGSFSLLTLWDPDGPGPVGPAPIAARGVFIPNDPTSYDALIFVGGAWAPVGDFRYPSGSESTYDFAYISAVKPLPNGASGVAPGACIFGGSFLTVDGIASVNAAILNPCVPAPCEGDITGDGRTDSGDFNIFALHFGESVPAGSGGDLNTDGVVNAADFNVLAGDFGCGG